MCGKNNLIEIKEQFDTLSKYQPYFKNHCCTTNFAMFTQTWADTALGFSGIGGSAITEALTICIPRKDVTDVFFGGMYAYTVPTGEFTEQRMNFITDINENKSAAPVYKAKERYGAYIDTYVQDCYQR